MEEKKKKLASKSSGPQLIPFSVTLPSLISQVGCFQLFKVSHITLCLFCFKLQTSEICFIGFYKWKRRESWAGRGKGQRRKGREQ